MRSSSQAGSTQIAVATEAVEATIKISKRLLWARRLLWQRDEFCFFGHPAKSALSPIALGLLNAIEPARNKVPPLVPLADRVAANPA